MAMYIKVFSLMYVLSIVDASGSDKLLLFLMDGIRWDYLDQDLPGFKELYSQGVRAEYMISDTPTLSYPNYYSLMTGLHCENHGMVGNYMYDIKHKEEFLIGTNPEQYHAFWWEDGEPLWITAVKEGKGAYMYYWPGCEVEIRGHNATYCKAYSGVPTITDLHNSIDESIALFKNNSADLVGIYVELPDKYGHKYGPGSQELSGVLKQIDSEMTRLLKVLTQENLRDDVNIIIFSDHGMTEVSPARVVNITDHINMADVEVMLDHGPNVYIWPKESKTETVYQNLMGMNNSHLMIYKKEDIPEDWYYKRHYRTPPIVLMAKLGWYIVTPKLPQYSTYSDSGPLKGHHGYVKDNIDMRAVFVATGPAFKKNFKAKPFANVNVYQIMCKLLDVTPLPHNGTWSLVKEMLKEDNPSSGRVTSYSFLVHVLTVMLSVIHQRSIY